MLYLRFAQILQCAVLFSTLQISFVSGSGVVPEFRGLQKSPRSQTEVDPGGPGVFNEGIPRNRMLARNYLYTSGFPVATEGPEENLYLKSKSNSEIDLTYSLINLATNVTELLDKIARNWILEGSKIIENGEVRFRDLQKELVEKVGKLIKNGSDYGQMIVRCINKMELQAQLDRVFNDTASCYSGLLKAIEIDLRKIEEQGGKLIRRLQRYTNDMTTKLEACFNNSDIATVVDCIQETELRSGIQEYEAVHLVSEITALVSILPTSFANCTMQGVAETEKQIKRSYAMSVTCVKKD